MTILVNNMAEESVPLVDTQQFSTKRVFLEKTLTVSQFLTWPVSYLFFHAFLKINIRGQDSFLLVKSPFIIIANHFAFYDSFLFRLILGFKTRLLPLRFMAVDKFNWKILNLFASLGIIKFIYMIFGAFIIKEGEGIEKGINEASKIIMIGGNVVMYPEGKINIENNIGVFKKGAAVLSQKTGVSVIPVSFRLGKKRFIRREIHINVGKQIPPSPTETAEETTKKFHQIISELYNTI